MANIQVGGKLGRNGRNGRIERPFAGVIAGLSVNRVRVLDLAAERDPHVTIKYDVQLVTGVLDRNDLQRMQQVRTTNIQFLLPFIYLNDIYILRIRRPIVVAFYVLWNIYYRCESVCEVRKWERTFFVWFLELSHCLSVVLFLYVMNVFVCL